MLLAGSRQNERARPEGRARLQLGERRCTARSVYPRRVSARGVELLSFPHSSPDCPILLSCDESLH